MTEHIQLTIDGLEYEVKPTPVTVKDCWQTPEHILTLVREVFEGQIHTDPCTAEDNPTNAIKFYTPKKNGLLHHWEKNAFINPPYSDPSGWIEEINRQLEVGNIKEAIALVPVGCLGTERTAPHAKKANAQCIWTNRIHFIEPTTGNPKTQTSFVSAFLYWGDRVEVFNKVFEHYGIISVMSLPYAQRLSKRILSNIQKNHTLVANDLCRELINELNETTLINLD
jgi:phage N-6-adenine-methyltransferase